MLHLLDDGIPAESEVRIKLGRLPCRVMCWFAANRDEELTSEDVGIKFSVEIRSVSTRLETLVKADILIRKKIVANGSSTYVYSIGPALKDMVDCIDTEGEVYE